MKTNLLAALAASLVLVACGGDSAPTDPAGLTNAAYEKFDAQDYEGAQADFQAAIDAGAADAALKDATMGLAKTTAHLDADKAAKTFLDFATAHADQVLAKDYSSIGGELVSAGGGLQAVDVVDAGLKRFEGDAGLMKAMDAIIKYSEKDPATASALSGLGYL